jgi:hypothetical protein
VGTVIGRSAVDGGDRDRQPSGVQQLVALHAPEVQPPHDTTPPLQFMQHRCLVPLCWQYGGVQAYPRAEGNSSSSTELLNRPSDLRMSVPICWPERVTI